MKKEAGIVVLFLFLLLFPFSCSPPKPGDTAGDKAGEALHYARGFRMVRGDGYTRITVVNPWDTTQVLHDYQLVPEDSGMEIPDAGNATRIIVPLRSLAVTGTVHAGMLEMLGAESLVNGVTEPQYMDFPFIREGIAGSSIADLGEPSTLNIEKLMEVAPGAVVLTTFPQANHGRLTKTGIPLIECVEYMENTPLGRAEWIKFIGAFIGKSREADSIYNEIEKNYREAAKLAQTEKERPTVFSEKKYRSVWSIPGGESYMAVFFRDAGADYLWKDDSHTGSLSLSFEEVYAWAEAADYWIIKYFDPVKELTYSELKSEYDPYSLFDAWKNRKIIGCNTAKTPYYGKGVMQPDLILKDMVKIFHPGMLEEYEFTYFKPLQ